MVKEHLTEPEFIALLRDLAKLKFVQVTGSYARGDYKYNSDIDFVVPRRKEDGYGNVIHPTPLEKAIAVLNAHGVQWDSEVLGQASTPRNLTYMPIPIEVMEKIWLTPVPKNKRLDKVVVYGIEFKTW